MSRHAVYVEVYTNLFDFREITLITPKRAMKFLTVSNLSLRKENEKLRANILPIDINEKQNRNLLMENKVLQQKLQDSEAYNRKLNEYYELAFREGFKKMSGILGFAPLPRNGKKIK